MAAPAPRWPQGNLVSLSTLLGSLPGSAAHSPVLVSAAPEHPRPAGQRWQLDLKLTSPGWHAPCRLRQMADSLPVPAAPVSKAGTLRLVSGKGRPACFARVRVLRLVEPTAFRADAVGPAGRVAAFLMPGGCR
jgi:hypothetical protein